MSSPFTLDANYGEAPGFDPAWNVGPKEFWLGRPDVGMYELPSPSVDGYDAAPSLGEVEHGLTSGASAVTIFDSVTRRWTITWPRLAGRDWQVIRGFYRRLFGAGPWCYVAPEDRNRLTLAQSLCGGLHGAAEGWVTSGGTVGFDATSVAPFLTPSGVLAWAPAAAGVTLTGGFATPDVDTDHAAPHLITKPATFGLWACTLTGTATVAARLTGRLTDGTLGVRVEGPDTTVGTSWTPVQVGAAPFTFDTAHYLVPDMISRDGNPVWLCCADMRYEDDLGDWETGAGVPRVIMVASPGRGLDPHMNSAVTMTLAEAVTGAA